MNDCESVRRILQDIGYVLTDNGREFRAKPLYRDSDNDSVLRIWKNSGQWVDFKENKSGSLEELIRLTLKLKSIEEAKQWIGAKGISVSNEEIEKPRAITKQIQYFEKSLLLKLTKNDDYWNNRGISSSTLAPFNGGVATTGKMYNRYTFPVFDNKDNIIGFSGRDVAPLSLEGRPKWKHIGDKKEWVYPLKVNLEDIKKCKKIILLESIGDMLALRENGINNSIVTFGLNVSAKIIYSLIALNPDKIVIAFNNDSGNNGAGNEAAISAKNKLLNYFDRNQISINLPVGAKDFGDLNLSDKNKIQEWYKTT
jgi:DNA primase